MAVSSFKRAEARDIVPRTQAASVYGKLRQDILAGRWKPGVRMRMEELKASYDVGLSPLREALMKLASEGLLLLEEHKGFMVSPVSKASLLDITSMRKELETLAIKRSIANGDDTWEAGIVASLHELGRRAKVGPDGLVDEEWKRRHHAFHDALTGACESEWLQRFRVQLYDQADRYIRLSIRYLTAARDELGEHKEIAQAVLARDVEQSTYLIRRHIDRTCQALLEENLPMLT